MQCKLQLHVIGCTQLSAVNISQASQCSVMFHAYLQSIRMMQINAYAMPAAYFKVWGGQWHALNLDTPVIHKLADAV